MTGLNELRIRLGETTHAAFHSFRDIRLQFSTFKTILKIWFLYIFVLCCANSNEALLILNNAAIIIYHNSKVFSEVLDTSKFDYI